MANKTKNLDLIKDVFYMITKQLFMQYLVLIKLNLLVKYNRHGVLAATDEKNNLLRKTIEWIRF